MNVVFKKLITWPTGAKKATVMENFRQSYGLLNVCGAIDDTHIINFKPIAPFLEDYYYHKTRGYSIQA
jgi:hypothetical protein